MERTTRPWQTLLGWGMAAAVLAWIAFRLFSRLSVEPYIDFRAFYEAAEAARTGGDPYVPVFGMYIYPPMLAAWMSPLSLLPQTAAAWVWFALGMVVSLLSLHLTWKALRERFDFPTGAGWFGVVLGMVLVFGMTQTRWEFEHGQCDWLLLLCFCVAFAALDRAPWVVGMALGFAINIKYLPVALLVYLATRRRWREVAWSCAGTLFWAMTPALVYGWSRNGHLLARGVSGLGKLVGVEGEGQPGMVYDLAFERSISLPSAFARLAGLYGMGFGAALFATGVVAAVVFVVGWAVYRRRGLSLWVGRGGAAERLPGNREIVALEWMVMLALTMVFSPQTMFRHTFLMLPLLMLAAGLAVAGQTQRCRRLAWVGLVVSGLGAVGGDLLSLVAPRPWWNFVGGSSYAALGLAYLTLVAGIEHVQGRERITGAVPERGVAA
jgi:hypothetical protein